MSADVVLCQDYGMSHEFLKLDGLERKEEKHALAPADRHGRVAWKFEGLLYC